MRKNELGKTMMEMLTVLAIIAILTVAGFPVAQKLMNKKHANAIVHEAQIAYVEKDNSPCDLQYHEVSMESDANVIYESYCDQKQDRYIVVSSVTDPVCREMLRMEQPEKLTFYAEDFNSKPSCNALQNTVVVSFGNLAPAIPCETVQDCPEGDLWVCDSGTGICKECDHEWMPNELKDGCKPFECENEELETLCSEGRDKWCCPKDLLCDIPNRSCKESTGYCNYYFSEPIVTKQYDCAYRFQEPKVTKVYDCAYRLVNDTSRTDVETITLQPVKTCANSNLYCNLKFSDTGCETNAAAGTAVGEIIYGSCSPMSVSYTGCTVTVDTSNVLTAVESCDNPNLYCHLKFSDKKCETNAAANATGIIYGSCSPMSVSYIGCTTTVITDGVLVAGQKCPESKYCYLKYDDEECTPAPADKTGVIFGVCLPPSSSNAICPIPTD